MSEETTTTLLPGDQKIMMHVRDKRAMQDFKQRRFEHWNENYALFRDKVETNRLTQRQKINIPMIKEALKSWIANIDEAPEMTFKSLLKGAEYRDKDIQLTELWNKFFDDEYLAIKDQAEKKIVGLQGVGFKEIGWSRQKNFPYCDVKDPYDILLEKGCDPFDLQRHRTIKVINIFKPLQEVLDTELYDQTARDNLRRHFEGGAGLIRADATDESYEMKENRMREMGAQNDISLDATIKKVELNVSYDMVWDKATQKYVRYYRVYAADVVCLIDKPMTEAFGFSFVPLVWWNVDPDINDPWTDGYADNMRPLNKVTNVYFSQDLENRAIRNFGMYFYNNMGGKFVPQSVDPRPFGMYGVPGNPREIMMQMDIQTLNDNIEQINYLKNMAQSSTAQTPTERGQASGAQTLGEVTMLKESSNAINYVDTKHYRKSWTDLAKMFIEILDVKQTAPINLYKEGNDGEFYEKKVNRQDWAIGAEGESSKKYKCIPVFKKEREQEDNFQIQKSQYVMNSFQNNPVALKIAKRKQLESLGWSAEDVEEAMRYEDQAMGAAQQQGEQDPTLQAQQMRNETEANVEGLQGQMQQQ